MLARLFDRLGRSSFARNIGALWIAEGIVVGFGVAQLAVAARFLGPTDYGVAALVLGYAALVYALLEPRSGQAVVKYVAEFLAQDDVPQLRAVAKLGYVVDGGFAVLSLVVTIGTATWAESTIIGADGTAVMLIGYAAAYTFRAPFNNALDVLTSLERFRDIAVVKAAGSGVRLALVVVFLSRFPSVGWFLAASAVGLIVEAVTMSVMASVAVRSRVGAGIWTAPLGPLRGRRREILGFVLHTNVNSLIRVLANQADIVILGYMRGPTEAGLYRLAKQISVFGTSVVTPLQSVTYPRLARLWARRDVAGLNQELRRTVTMVALPLAGLALLTLPVIGLVVRVVGGSEFTGAIRPTQILVAVVAIWFAFYWLQPMFFSLGRVRPWTVSIGAGVVLALVGFVYLGDRFGATGFALSRLIAIGGVTHGLGLFLLARDWPSRASAGTTRAVPPPRA